MLWIFVKMQYGPTYPGTGERAYGMTLTMHVVINMYEIVPYILILFLISRMYA